VKVIFLDFDGVMDTAYYDHVLVSEGKAECDEFGAVFDPECVRQLQKIVEETGADIVVTSTWKVFMTYQDFLEMWKVRQLPGFVTDLTPSISRFRGDEIDAWLKECGENCRYVIIDDLDGSNFLPHQIPWLLVVNPYNGLDDETAKRAICLLNS
jgi:hypothetical protein